MWRKLRVAEFDDKKIWAITLVSTCEKVLRSPQQQSDTPTKRTNCHNLPMAMAQRYHRAWLNLRQNQLFIKTLIVYYKQLSLCKNTSVASRSVKKGIFLLMYEFMLMNMWNAVWEQVWHRIFNGCGERLAPVRISRRWTG